MTIVNNVTRFLDSRKVSYEIFELPLEKLSALDVAHLLDVEPDSVFNQYDCVACQSVVLLATYGVGHWPRYSRIFCFWLWSLAQCRLGGAKDQRAYGERIEGLAGWPVRQIAEKKVDPGLSYQDHARF